VLTCFDFSDFFDFESSFSIEFYTFSLKLSVEWTRSGRDLLLPVERNSKYIDFLQNFHPRKLRFFKSFSLRKTM